MALAVVSLTVTKTKGHFENRIESRNMQSILQSVLADKFLVLIGAFLLIGASIGCDRSASDLDDEIDAVIAQPQGDGSVTIVIKGSREQLRLVRVLANQLTAIDSVAAGPSSTEFEVESGFYVIQFESNRPAIAVPAIRPIAPERIEVEIQPVPDSQAGWCWIPAGPALVGDTLGVGRANERPARIETVQAFWLAEKEITNGQYAEFLNHYVGQQKQIPSNWIDLESRKCLIERNESGKFFSPDSDLPLVMVSLYGARAYCEWLTESTGQLHRLPSEIEWEKAARGPESFVYSYGNIYQQAGANQESGQLKPVGSYPPNSFGLYDMTGNVFEWMADAADPDKQETTLNHSLRGGSFMLDGLYLRNSFRMKQSPSVMTDDIGFRVAREPDSQTSRGSEEPEQ